jgi:nicotinate-nucleotide--dimethylbenzimidazole phosphoribosyltransferase
MPDHSPFDDIRNLLQSLPDGDDAAGAIARASCRKASLSAGGAMENAAVWLSTWSGDAPPHVNKPVIAIFAGAHGVAAHGVSGPSDEQVSAYVGAVSAGQGVLARLCASGNLGLKMLDLALDVPTGDIVQDAALDGRVCAATIAFGMEAVAGGHDLVCLSSIGAGGEASAAALLAAISGGKPSLWVSRNSPQHVVLRETAAIEAALSRHKSSPADALELMSRLGGREIAAMAGAIIAARVEKAPIVLEDITALAAAAVLHHIRPDAVTHCMLAARLPLERAAETARIIGMEHLSVESAGVGPGVDSALAVGVLKAAALAAA